MQVMQSSFDNYFSITLGRREGFNKHNVGMLIRLLWLSFVE